MCRPAVVCSQAGSAGPSAALTDREQCVYRAIRPREGCRGVTNRALDDLAYAFEVQCHHTAIHEIPHAAGRARQSQRRRAVLLKLGDGDEGDEVANDPSGVTVPTQVLAADPIATRNV